MNLWKVKYSNSKYPHNRMNVDHDLLGVFKLKKQTNKKEKIFRFNYS